MSTKSISGLIPSLLKLHVYILELYLAQAFSKLSIFFGLAKGLVLCKGSWWPCKRAVGLE